MKKCFAVFAVMVVIVVGFIATAVAEESVQRHFVNFQIGKSDVDKQKVLDKLVNVKPDSKIEIYGYTDEQGSADINIALSHKRAEVIAGVVKGIMPEVKIRLVKGMPYTGDKSVNATSGEIRIYTPVKVIPAVVPDSNRVFMRYTAIAAVVFLCFIVILAIALHERRNRKKVLKTQMWPSVLSEIAVMYQEKLNGQVVKKCPFCGTEVSGKNYVAHLRRCVKSLLFEKNADEAKTILMEARR